MIGSNIGYCNFKPNNMIPEPIIESHFFNLFYTLSQLFMSYYLVLLIMLLTSDLCVINKPNLIVVMKSKYVCVFNKP